MDFLSEIENAGDSCRRFNLKQINIDCDKMEKCTDKNKDMPNKMRKLK